jgi:hypothetical protein
MKNVLYLFTACENFFKPSYYELIVNAIDTYGFNYTGSIS